MDKTFEQGKKEIAALCEHFATNRDAYREAGYKEAQVRLNLIDPLFEALGWDIRNAAMAAPQYREVIPEPSLDVEGQQKAPDYTFRVGTLPKFYVEAKKCGVNIDSDAAPAYQLRRYGWSAKVAVSILTDFEELAVYDCTIRPRQTDKASHARILYLRFNEFPSRWRELWDVFSREKVWSGAFDQYAASKRKRGTSEVDDEFLKEIEGWRDELAHNIALRNRGLANEDLNRAVQLTIDRLVFLRMAEDRGLESYEQLLKLCEREDVYARFMGELCRRADDKYNSGLFHFQKETGVAEQPDNITPNLAVDDKVFKPIVQSLYFQYGCPYHFGVMPVEILGTVYERFLGKVIRLTEDHHAKVEEKPEVRKAGGVYYTPSYIVDYIVAQTVGRKIEGKSPMQLSGSTGVSPVIGSTGVSPVIGSTGVSPVGITHRRDACGTKQPFRVLDMACGSGSFLLGAYKLLLDHCLKWYSEHKAKKYKQAVYKDPRNGHWRLTIQEKKRILTTHIFGVDIDPQAVEVSKLSLLLKVLEGETDQSLHMSMLPFHDRALPNLAENIKCGNSLIGTNYFTGKLIPDADEMKRVNAFDWNVGFPDAMKSGGFDCIIGNPPYVRQEGLGKDKEYYQLHYKTFRPTSDLYVNFVEKGIGLLNPSGSFGMIVSNKWIRSDYGRPLREFLSKQSTVQEIIDFAGLPVFAGATVRTVILICAPKPQLQRNLQYLPPVSNKVFSTIKTGESLSEIVHEQGIRVPLKSLSNEGWFFGDIGKQNVMDKIFKKGSPLKEFLKKKIYRGLITGSNSAFVIDRKTRKSLVSKNPKNAEIIKPLLVGRNIGRYSIHFEDKYLICTKVGVPIKKYPQILDHLKRYEPQLRKRWDKGKYWWELRECDYYDKFSCPKIIFPDIATTCRFTIDREGIYSLNTTYFIPSDDLYLLGILNSKIGNYCFSRICAGLESKGVTYLRFFGQYIERFPIYSINLSNRSEKTDHDRIVKLVDSMLALHKHFLAAKSEQQKGVIRRQIEATDREIDRLVYSLYGLTKAEIAIVEGAEK